MTAFCVCGHYALQHTPVGCSYCECAKSPPEKTFYSSLEEANKRAGAMVLDAMEAVGTLRVHGYRAPLDPKAVAGVMRFQGDTPGITPEIAQELVDEGQADARAYRQRRKEANAQVVQRGTVVMPVDELIRLTNIGNASKQEEARYKTVKLYLDTLDHVRALRNGKKHASGKKGREVERALVIVEAEMRRMFP